MPTFYCLSLWPDWFGKGRATHGMHGCAHGCALQPPEGLDVFGRTLNTYGHRCQLNSHKLDRNQAISTYLNDEMQHDANILANWLTQKNMIKNIALTHQHFCHSSQVKSGIFTWMVPVLAIVAWLEELKVAVQRWPVMWGFS